MNKRFLTSLLLMGAAAPALAVPPHTPSIYAGGNLWSITAYNDADPAQAQWATQYICFLPPAVVGTHERGVWYSLSFPDWNGTYSQEGDQVFMYGDYAKDVGHDGIQISLDTARTASGHWKEWRENGAFGITIGFLNTTLQRIGTCKTFTPPTAGWGSFDWTALNIPPRFLLDGKVAQFPVEPKQRPLDVLALPYVGEIFK